MREGFKKVHFQDPDRIHGNLEVTISQEMLPYRKNSFQKFPFTNFSGSRTLKFMTALPLPSMRMMKATLTPLVISKFPQTAFMGAHESALSLCLC